MDFKIDKINKLVDVRHDGYKTEFAEALGINRPTVSQILNKSMPPTKSFITRFYFYCKRNNLKFDSFVDIEKVKKVN